MKRIFAVALVLLLAACAGERRVVIVSTNDIHAGIDNFPRLATLVEAVRDSVGADRVLLVDAGDRWTGNPFVDKAERPLSPIVELQNELGYDVTTLGNHEFDWGQPLLRERIDEMTFPVVCANIESAGSELGPIAPYAFIEAGGIRFAFLGMVHNFSHWKRPEGRVEHFVGLSFPDVYETAEKYSALAAGCDVLVGLTHIGYSADLTLAEQVPEIDLIIGGHSHTVVSEPVVVGETLVTQTGSRLTYAGITTVTKKGRRGPITIENRLVKLDTIAPEPRFEQQVNRYNDNPALLTPIGTAAAPFGKPGMKNLVADAVRTALGADIALYHSGGIRVDTLAGAINTADLFRIEPFLSEIFTLRMTPGQIKGLIMNRFGEVAGPDVMPAGLGYTIVTDEAGRAVNVVFDRPERASYFVAMPDYLYKNYVFDRSENAVETGVQVTSAMRDYITARNPVVPDNTPRIAIE